MNFVSWFTDESNDGGGEGEDLIGGRRETGRSFDPEIDDDTSLQWREVADEEEESDEGNRREGGGGG